MVKSISTEDLIETIRHEFRDFVCEENRKKLEKKGGYERGGYDITRGADTILREGYSMFFHVIPVFIYRQFFLQ